jgi:HEPN domain-containing protein
MIELHEAWIFRAENDLRLAEVGIRQDDPITDAAIYHTQQCAEKALKGFLALHQAEIKRIHDLTKLIDMCAVFDSSFESLLLEASDLTPKGTEFRYLDDYDMVDDLSQLLPEVEEVEEAIIKAKRILDFVKAKLPAREATK